MCSVSSWSGEAPPPQKKKHGMRQCVQPFAGTECDSKSGVSPVCWGAAPAPTWAAGSGSGAPSGGARGWAAARALEACSWLRVAPRGCWVHGWAWRKEAPPRPGWRAAVAPERRDAAAAAAGEEPAGWKWMCWVGGLHPWCFGLQAHRASASRGVPARWEGGWSSAAAKQGATDASWAQGHTLKLLQLILNLQKLFQERREI